MSKKRIFKPRSNGMTHKSFVTIIAILTAVLLLFAGTGAINIDVLLNKLTNITAVLLFSSMFNHYWLGRVNRIDEKIFTNAIAVSIFTGLHALALAVAVIA